MIQQLIYVAAVLLQVATAAPGDHQRIVGGTDASITDYPFMVSLRWEDGKHACGGSIYNEHWILTAAHCVNYYTSTYLQTVQVGRSDVSPGTDASVYKIVDVIVHEHYNPDNSRINDVALLRLATPLSFSDTVQPVVLPTVDFSDLEESDLAVTLIGWGLLETDGAQPTTLQQVHYSAVPNEECNQIFRALLKHIYPSQICAYYPDGPGGKGQCNGDSGGPLLHNGVQVGIVSWSERPCTEAPYPGVLAKVSYYIDWIKRNVY